MMMNFLAICGLNSDGTAVSMQPLWNVVNFIVNALMIGVPIALIIWGMFDLGRAVIASKEDEVKKATKLLGKRFLFAIGVFAMVWFVTFVFDIAGNAVGQGENVEGDATSNPDIVINKSNTKNQWSYCWKCNIRGGGKENCDLG